MSENTNCLENCACPKCGQKDTFRVLATSWFIMHDEGTSEFGDVEYDGESYTSCPACGWQGRWKYLSQSDPDFMDQSLWNSLGDAGRTAWKEKRGIKPYPKQLAPYYGDRVEVETTYGEKRRFWVGVSTGWRPCYLEVKRRDSSGGEACDSQYRNIKLIEKGPRN